MPNDDKRDVTEKDVSVPPSEDETPTAPDGPQAGEERPADAPEEKKSNPIAEFFRERGGVIAAAAAFLGVIVMMALAIVLGGDVYDKAAMLWIAAFLVELVYHRSVKRDRASLVMLIVTGVLAVGFIVLYGLELGGILP